MTWYDTIWYDMIQHHMIWRRWHWTWCDATWYEWGMAWFGMIWNGMIGYDMTWHGTWYDMIRYDMICHDIRFMTFVCLGAVLDEVYNRTVEDVDNILKYVLPIKLTWHAWPLVGREHNLLKCDDAEGTGVKGISRANWKSGIAPPPPSPFPPSPPHHLSIPWPTWSTVCARLFHSVSCG